MKKLLVAFTLVAILSATAIGIVMAQDTTPETPSSPLCPYCGTSDGTWGRGAGSGYMMNEMHAAYAEVLGITLDEFEARMQAGETLSEIAESLGFDAAETFRYHFRRVCGTSPRDYRTSFRGA